MTGIQRPTTVFIAGSISIKSIHKDVKDRISNIVEKGHDIVVGDADGADKAIQRTLADFNYIRATVYCAGSKPRNNVGDRIFYPVSTNHKPGSREFYTAKDRNMAMFSETAHDVVSWFG